MFNVRIHKKKGKKMAGRLMMGFCVENGHITIICDKTKNKSGKCFALIRLWDYTSIYCLPFLRGW